jgi:hypothetical protein
MWLSATSVSWRIATARTATLAGPLAKALPIPTTARAICGAGSICDGGLMLWRLPR